MAAAPGRANAARHRPAHAPWRRRQRGAAPAPASGAGRGVRAPGSRPAGQGSGRAAPSPFLRDSHSGRPRRTLGRCGECGGGDPAPAASPHRAGLPPCCRRALARVTPRNSSTLGLKVSEEDPPIFSPSLWARLLSLVPPSPILCPPVPRDCLGPLSLLLDLRGASALTPGGLHIDATSPEVLLLFTS